MHDKSYIDFVNAHEFEKKSYSQRRSHIPQYQAQDCEIVINMDFVNYLIYTKQLFRNVSFTQLA